MSQAHGPTNEETTLADFTPTQYQDEFLRGDKRYLSFVSGVGAGKTYAGIIRTFLNMEKWNPGEMGAIVAPTRQMVVNVIIPEMRDLGLLDKWDYNSSYSDEPGLHSPNGSRALILSADNSKTVERLRGLNLAWGWIDERTAVPDRAKEILSQRLRTGNYRNLFETTTPKGKDSTYEFYTQENSPEKRSFGQATIYESSDRLAIVGVPTDANPNTPDDYKEDMKNLPEEIRAQEVQGQFVEIGSGVYQRDHFSIIPPSEVQSDDTSNWWKTIIGVDPAVQADSAKAEAQDSDYWAVTVADCYTRSGEIYITDTEKRRGMTLQEGVEWLSAIYKQVDDAQMVVESNQAQTYLVNALNQAGISVTGETTTTNKEARLTDLSIPISNGTVQFVNWNYDKPGEGHPYQDLVQEALAFPNSEHDDQLDSLAITVKHAPVNTSSTISTVDGWGLDEDE